MVKVSGQWVHPMEVERCLISHPAVQECVVMAVEDEKRLVSLKAWVVLKPGHHPDAATTRTLQDFVKRSLLPYKYPRLVEYLAEFPKTGTNKVDRQALRRSPKDATSR
jgi:acyl-coenzyme A synthetase/AMP-(fatty) acid ligase